MGVLEPTGALQFKALYPLSAPSKQYADGAKFVFNSIEQGNDGYIYIWGAQGGAQSRYSAPYLARLKPADIANGAGIEYFSGHLPDGSPKFRPGESSALALFNDSPSCASDMGVQWNPYVQRWIMIYNCADNTPGHRFGIWMRTAANPWGPYSAPQTIFNPGRDRGYCYFIHYSKCPKGSPNPANSGSHDGFYYAPYFIADWMSGTTGTAARAATSTLYYTLSTWNPYGEVILESKIRAPLQIVPAKPSPSPLPSRPPSPCPPHKPGTPITCT